MYSSSAISTYFHFGYIPDCNHKPLSLVGEVSSFQERQNLYAKTAYSELVEVGARLIRKVFKQLASESADRQNVVPISGGLDSRAILAGLLEHIPSNRISTVTYGIPGTYDFNIGALIARKAGVENWQIDLSSNQWNWDADKLVETMSFIGAPVPVFEAHINHKALSVYGKDVIGWSGFVGETSTGAHLTKKIDETWGEAKNEFIKKNMICDAQFLFPHQFDPEQWIPNRPFVDKKVLSYGEQLDFGIRQKCYIQKVIVPSTIRMQTPFIHPEWLLFILNVPRRYRIGQQLYKDILLQAFPKLFSLPTKTNLGLPLTSPKWRIGLRKQLLKVRRKIGGRSLVAKTTNYVNFDKEIKKREDLRCVVSDCAKAVSKRGIIKETDLEQLWNEHFHEGISHGVTLQMLASLEICIRAKLIEI